MRKDNTQNQNDGPDWQNPSQTDGDCGDVTRLIPQGDAIYDYERVPAAWIGFDDQPSIYSYGGAVDNAEEVARKRRAS